MAIVRSPIGRDDRPDASGSRLLDASGSRVLDAALVAAVALAGLVVLLGPPPTAEYRDPDVGAVLLVLASAASLWWWRTAPRASLFAACAVVVVNAAAGYSVGVVQYPVWIALYSVFARSPRRDRVGAMVAVAVTLVGYAVADRGTLDLLTVLGIVVAFVVAVLLGDGTRSRRDLAASERAAAELHEREQEAAMERLVLQERARLARELHDSVGHAINVMVMQAGVGRHVFDERPQFAREALAHVEDVGRVALGELDAVLRVLRPADGTAYHEPASPTLAGLETLCDRIRATGREVDLEVEDVDLAPSAERATYRIVQEAVTNAARHTTSGRIRVSIARANGDVVVTIHNAGARLAPPVAGRGLVNMRERALLEGGQLECGPVADGFRVRATLPAREVNPRVIAVLLADDDVLVRQGLRVLIESADDLAVVAEAADGEEAVHLAATTTPDVVVMDVRMPGQDGIAATQEIASWPQPRPRVLVLTTFDLDDIVHDALQAGADGFLLKRSTPDELINGIRTVAAGDALISPALTRRLLSYVANRNTATPSTAALVVPFTAREAEVLRYLSEGLSNAEIATRLAIGQETVKTHLKRICTKTGARDRTQAVVWAYQTGFVAS